LSETKRRKKPHSLSTKKTNQKISIATKNCKKYIQLKIYLTTKFKNKRKPGRRRRRKTKRVCIRIDK
jgi:hypothetical protein